MFKRSKVYYVVGDGKKINGNTRVTTDDAFDEKDTSDSDRILTRRNFGEYMEMVVAPKFFKVLDIVVDIASVAGVFMLLFNGLSHLLDINEND